MNVLKDSKNGIKFCNFQISLSKEKSSINSLEINTSISWSKSYWTPLGKPSEKSFGRSKQHPVCGSAVRLAYTALAEHSSRWDLQSYFINAKEVPSCT